MMTAQPDKNPLLFDIKAYIFSLIFMRKLPISVAKFAQFHFYRAIQLYAFLLFFEKKK